MDFLSNGWIWMYVGAGLMLAEILTPGFVMFFFGLSAATVGLLVLLLPEPFSPTLMWQLALFSLFSLVEHTRVYSALMSFFTEFR